MFFPTFGFMGFFLVLFFKRNLFISHLTQIFLQLKDSLKKELEDLQLLSNT